MNLLNSSKLVNRSLIGAVGLSASAIALLGSSYAAKAADVNGGSDYLVTLPATFLDFSDLTGGQIGLVNFMGSPINPGKIGNTDTIVQREDCTFVSGECTVDIEMTDLFLKSIDPVDIGGSNYDVFVMVDDRDLDMDGMPDNPSDGTMTIKDDGTFGSILDVFFKAQFTPIDGGNPIPDFFGEKTFIVPNFQGQWTDTPPPTAVIIEPGDQTISRGIMLTADDQTANYHPNGMGVDFFVTSAFHETDDGKGTHIVEFAKVPEPSATVPLALLGLAGIWGLKKKKKKEFNS